MEIIYYYPKWNLGGADYFVVVVGTIFLLKITKILILFLFSIFVLTDAGGAYAGLTQQSETRE